VSKLQPIDLLRLIYRHLDFESLLRGNPSLKKENVEEFFKRLASLLGEGVPMPHREDVIVSCDGSSRGNPGDAGIGIVVADAGGRSIIEKGKYIGRATSNVAEYKAAIFALEEAKRLGARRVTLRADSELLVRQVRGEYRVRNAALARLYAELMAALKSFDEVKIEQVPREENTIADSLATAAADPAALRRGRGDS